MCQRPKRRPTAHRSERLASPASATRSVARLAAVVWCGWCGHPAAAPAIGQFELKTLESAPGSLEFQSQNAWVWGEPARLIASDDADSFVPDENSIARQRHALELEMGFTSRLKMRVGVEFEKERLDDPDTLEQADGYDDLSLTEVGAEVIAILAPRMGDGAGFGLVAEIEGPIDQKEPNHLTLGPIMELQSGRWFAAAVPMLVYAFGGDSEPGERLDDKWDFAYATQLMYTFSERWSLALEGYGAVERLGDSGRPSESAQVFGDFNQHRVGAVAYYTYPLGDARDRAQASSAAAADIAEEREGASLSVGLGLLEGLNGATPDHTLKLSIEVQF